ncbi:MAG: hypothetical protein ABJD07_04345 [Gemmatimonadaceae bacterium]
MADTEFPGGGSYDHATSAPSPLADDATRGSASASSPLESLTLFVTETVPSALVDIIEAVHDHFQSPEDHAKEHMEHVTELHQQMMEHLAAGDVDGAVALNAQAADELNSAVLSLTDPNHRDSHHHESHDEAPAAVFFPQQDETPAVAFFPQPMDGASQLPGEYGHVDDHAGHG